MSHAQRLGEWLARRPTVDGAALEGWRFELVESVGTRVGVRDSGLGGPYEGPGTAVRLGGSIELHWSDGLFTGSSLDRRAILAPERELAGWRTDAVTPRGGRLPPLAGPMVLAEIEVFDPAVTEAMASGATALLQVPQRLLDGTRAGGARRTDAVVRASRNTRTVATSPGFWATWTDTACTVELWVDELVGVTYGRRALPGADDLDRLVREAVGLAPLMRQETTLPADARGVLLMPRVVQEVLGRLLMPNLAGRAIRDGRSPFTRADLEAGRQVLRADLDLTVDTTLPLELASAPCSPEGVPAGRVALIAGGKLASPVLDAATSPEFGLPPTPVPRGQPGVILGSTRPALDLDEALALLGSGAIVRDLPGLHTQQPRRSSYALTAPDAQVVVDGQPGGRCAVRVAGSLLAQLSHPSTQIVRLDGQAGVALLILDALDIRPA